MIKSTINSPEVVQPAEIDITTARTFRQRRQFLELPYSLYRSNTCWVPQLRMAQKALLNLTRHPFYKTSEVEMFLAYREGRVVGRIMAIINRAHNEFHGEQAGFFGFFEVENDRAAALSLVDAAREWLGAKGMEIMRGPVNPSTNYECGLLVEGFDRPPAVMMPYNPPYYMELLEYCGLRKAMDLYAYYVDEDSFNVSDKLTRVAERARSREGIIVRTVDLKHLDREVEAVRSVYNDAWSRNWGFVPVNAEEFEHLAKDLKQIVDSEIVYIAERKSDGRPVGFCLAVPDFNHALRHASGRLLPFGIFKLLWHSRRIKSIRVITMGVAKEYQNVGIAAVFYDELYRRGRARGYTNGEMSWILENNTMMIRAAQMLGGRLYKKYRIYEMPIV